MHTVSPSLKSLSRKRQRQGMGSPVAPLITPWNGEVGQAGGGAPVAAALPDGSAAPVGSSNATTIATAMATETRQSLAFAIPCTRKLTTT